MLREGLLTKGLRHENINHLLAVCFTSDEHDNHQLQELQQLTPLQQLKRFKSPLLIYPFMNEGNLKQFLLRRWGSDVGNHQVSIKMAAFQEEMGVTLR